MMMRELASQLDSTYWFRQFRAKWITFCMCACLVGLLTAIQSAAWAGPTTDSYQKDLAAAQRGDSSSQVRLGIDLYTAAGTGLNYTDAISWFNKAAAAGSAEGKAWLGDSYLFGRGQIRDVDRGLTLLRSAGEAGSPTAYRFLGIIAMNGWFVQKNVSLATTAFRQAVQLGDDTSRAYLASLYLYGDGSDAHIVKGIAILHAGVAKDNEWCMVELARFYEATPSDLAQLASKQVILNLYRRAAAKGNSAANYELGRIYSQNELLKEDDAKAFKYYMQAAIRYELLAQLAVARAYELGVGVPVNLASAYYWYHVASEHGDGRGLRAMHDLVPRMTPTEISEAVGRLNQWTALHPSSKGEDSF